MSETFVNMGLCGNTHCRELLQPALHRAPRCYSVVRAYAIICRRIKFRYRRIACVLHYYRGSLLYFGIAGVPVANEKFMELTRKPIVIYFGGYISESGATTLGGSNWEVRLKMAREFVCAINRHGGNATLVELKSPLQS